MRMQRVQIDVPAFEGYDFLRFGTVHESELNDSNIKACKASQSDDGTYYYGLLNTAKWFYNGESCLIYRKKQHNKIIFEEIKTDYPVFGEFYLRDDGSVVRWKSSHQSETRFRIFKLIQGTEKWK